jgi:hypothetical protein
MPLRPTPRASGAPTRSRRRRTPSRRRAPPRGWAAASRQPPATGWSLRTAPAGPSPGRWASRRTRATRAAGRRSAAPAPPPDRARPRCAPALVVPTRARPSPVARAIPRPSRSVSDQAPTVGNREVGRNRTCDLSAGEARSFTRLSRTPPGRSVRLRASELFGAGRGPAEQRRTAVEYPRDACRTRHEGPGPCRRGEGSGRARICELPDDESMR